MVEDENQALHTEVTVLLIKANNVSRPWLLQVHSVQ